MQLGDLLELPADDSSFVTYVGLRTSASNVLLHLLKIWLPLLELRLVSWIGVVGLEWRFGCPTTRRENG